MSLVLNSNRNNIKLVLKKRFFFFLFLSNLGGISVEYIILYNHMSLYIYIDEAFSYKLVINYCFRIVFFFMDEYKTIAIL